MNRQHGGIPPVPFTFASSFSYSGNFNLSLSIPYAPLPPHPHPVPIVWLVLSLLGSSHWLGTIGAQHSWIVFHSKLRELDLLLMGWWIQMGRCFLQNIVSDMISLFSITIFSGSSFERFQRGGGGEKGNPTSSSHTSCKIHFTWFIAYIYTDRSQSSKRKVVQSCGYWPWGVRNPRRQAGGFMISLPVWNLRAASLIPLFYIPSLVLMPSPVALSVLSFSVFAHSPDLFPPKPSFFER